ncbi:hypothetical protein LCGC14_1426030 [marine sediment metagenome]|uniref:Uncharacterized protein n=1 Tax=marine sediment metagenome TaxID=412755 RepID=A0A0F9JPX6_9ZZZZ
MDLNKIYLIDEMSGKRITMTVTELLEKVNYNRSADWIDYDINDLILHSVGEILDWIEYCLDSEYYGE